MSADVDEHKITTHAEWAIQSRAKDSERQDSVHAHSALVWTAEHAALQTVYLQRINQTLLKIYGALCTVIVLLSIVAVVAIGIVSKAIHGW